MEVIMKKNLLALMFFLIFLISFNSYAHIEESISTENIDINYTETSYEAALIERMKPLEEEFEYDLDNGSTATMLNAATTLFEAWDKELNVVYKLLMEKSSKKEKADLRKEERDWIKKKEKDAKKASKEFKGGSWEGLFYRRSELISTKKRAIELAKLYDEKNSDKERGSYEFNLRKRMKPFQKKFDSEVSRGSTLEMLEAGQNLLAIWEKEMNKISNLIINKLPENEKLKFEKERIKWEEEKEKNALKSSEENRGGSLERFSILGTYLDETEKRTIELAKRYDNMINKK